MQQAKRTVESSPWRGPMTRELERSSSSREVAARRGWIRRLIATIVPPLAMLVVLVVAWMLAIRLTDTPPLLAPSPGDVLNGFRDNWADLLTASWSTFRDAALGFVLSIVIGVLLAMGMSQSRLLERAVYPYTTLAQTIPIYAVAPLIGELVKGQHAPIVVVSLIIAIFPVIANATLGLTSVDSNHVNLFEMYNASRLQQLLYLRLPYAVPYILAGIRVSSGLAIVGATVAEMLLGSGGADGGGLGYEISYAAPQGLWDLLGAAALAAGILGVAVFAVVGAFTSLALRNWHESARERDD